MECKVEFVPDADKRTWPTRRQVCARRFAEALQAGIRKIFVSDDWGDDIRFAGVVGFWVRRQSQPRGEGLPTDPTC